MTSVNSQKIDKDHLSVVSPSLRERELEEEILRLVKEISTLKNKLKQCKSKPDTNSSNLVKYQTIPTPKYQPTRGDRISLIGANNDTKSDFNESLLSIDDIDINAQSFSVITNKIQIK